MKPKFVTPYDFNPNHEDKSKPDWSLLLTIPDQVLSMREIYERYVVRGEIAGLAQGARIGVYDGIEDPDVEPDDTVDALQIASSIRMRQSLADDEQKPRQDPVGIFEPPKDSEPPKDLEPPKDPEPLNLTP